MSRKSAEYIEIYPQHTTTASDTPSSPPTNLAPRSRLFYFMRPHRGGDGSRTRSRPELVIKRRRRPMRQSSTSSSATRSQVIELEQDEVERSMGHAAAPRTWPPSQLHSHSPGHQDVQQHHSSLPGVDMPLVPDEPMIASGTLQLDQVLAQNAALRAEIADLKRKVLHCTKCQDQCQYKPGEGSLPTSDEEDFRSTPVLLKSQESRPRTFRVTREYDEVRGVNIETRVPVRPHVRWQDEEDGS